VLYKLELMREKIQKAIRTHHIHILKELNGAPHETYLDFSKALGGVEAVVDAVIGAHEGDVLEEREAGSVLKKKIQLLEEELAGLDDVWESKLHDAIIDRARILRDRNRMEELIEDLEGRVRESARAEKETRRELGKAEEERVRAVRGKAGAEQRLEQEKRSLEEARKELVRLRAELDQYRRGDAPYKGVATRKTREAKQLSQQVNDLRREISDYEDLLIAETPTSSEYLAMVPSFSDTINEDPPTPEDNVVYLRLCDAVDYILSTLTPREEKVLRMRFGIGEKSDHTLEEVARAFGLSRERIRMIEAKAMRKLRNPSRAKFVKSFLGDHRDGWVGLSASRRRWVGNIQRLWSVECSAAETKKKEKKKKKTTTTRRRAVGQKSGRGKEEMVRSKLRRMMIRRGGVPYREFVEKTGIDITTGQYARCLRAVREEKGIYVPRGGKKKKGGVR